MVDCNKPHNALTWFIKIMLTIQWKDNIRMQSSWNTYFVVWNYCRCIFSRTWRRVESRQVPPLSVAGLSATARLIEPLQHRTRSRLNPIAATAAKTNVQATDRTLTGHMSHGALHSCKDVKPRVCFLLKWIKKGFLVNKCFCLFHNNILN